jgi:hypoxanthine phosphoribosyltransferase
MDALHVSWDDYHRLIERLAVRIHESGWTFDAVVCLARGGLRVGDVLSRVFERPLGVLFTSSYREDAGTVQGRLAIAEHLSSAAPLPGTRWLLVDDLADSGATLAEVLPALRARHPQLTEIRTAVLWCKRRSTVVPDYMVERLASDPWIHQPFEIYDRLSPAELASRRGSR